MECGVKPPHSIIDTMKRLVESITMTNTIPSVTEWLLSQEL